MDQLWRELKRLIAANRQAESIDALAADAAAWLLTLTPQQARRKAAMTSSRFWLKSLLQVGWTAPNGIDVPECGSFEPAKGAVRDEHYHDRAGYRQDGLFAKDKFCLIRRGQLVLPQRGARSGADRALPDAGSAVPKGSRPFGVDHEAAAVGGSPAAGRPSDGATAVGQGLSVASAGDHRAHRPACCSGHSAGRRGGEPSCK